MRRRRLTFAGAVLAIACLAFFSNQLARLVAEGTTSLFDSLPQLVPALCTFLAAYAAFAYGWHALLRAGRLQPPRLVSAGIFSTTQFAKYLPGNVGHHVGRVALAVRYGLPAPTVVATMIVETIIVVAWMTVLGFPLLEFWLERLQLDIRSLLPVLAGASVLVIGIGLLLRRTRRHPRIAGLLSTTGPLLRPDRRSMGFLAGSVFLILAGIVLSALSLALLDTQRVLLSIDVFPVALGLFACAWLLGFLAPGAPAGIGIREVVLTEGLSPLVGRDQAIVIALLFRILSTGADSLVFCAGLGMLWRAGKPRTP